ncbi:MAG: translocation/assembly module TamB domain-containing protein, partial [Deltaproteobacteria bacterium]|nr:translocation/assembly module TamB domain-containing protein [Deltaproteobacteria bacterium]
MAGNTPIRDGPERNAPERNAPERDAPERADRLLAASPKTGKHRWLPWRIIRALIVSVGWIILVVVLIVLATISVARLPAAQDKIVEMILAQTRERLPGLSIGAIRGDITSTLTIYDVRLADRFGGDAISLRALHLDYAPAALLSSEAMIERIVIVQPQIVIKKAQSGKLNLTELVAPPKTPPEPEPPEPESRPGKAPRGLATLKALQILDGHVTVTLDPQEPIEIRDLQVDIGGQGSATKQRLTLRKLSLTVKLPKRPPISLALSGDTALVGDHAVTEVGALTKRALTTTLGLTIRGALPEATENNVRLDVNAKGPLSGARLRVGLALPGAARFAIVGKAGVDARFSPHFDVTMTLRHLNPKRLLPSLLPGDINLSLTVAGKGVPLAPKSTLAATLHVAPSKVGPTAIDALDLDAKLAGKRWTLRKLRLRAGKTQVDAAGAGDLSRLTRLTISVKAPNLARLPLPVKVPGLAGAINLRASAHGPFRGPLAATVALRGRNLGVAQVRVASVDLKARFQGLPKKPRGHLRLRAEAIDPGNPKLFVKRAVIDVSGHPKKLTINLEADGKTLFARLGAVVSLTAKRIHASLSRLRFRGFGQRLALHGQTEVDVLPGRRVTVKGLKVATYGGIIGLEATLKQVGEPRIRGSLTLAGIVPPLGKDRATRRAARALKINGRVDAEVRSRGAKAQARFTLGRRGRHGRLTLDATVPLRRQRGAPIPTHLDRRRPVALALKLSSLSLAPLRQALGKKLPPVAGRVDLDVTARGRLNDLSTRIALRLRDADTLGLHPVDARMLAEISPQRSHLEVNASIDRQHIFELSGGADLGAGAFTRGKLPSRARLATVPVTLAVSMPRLALARLAPLAKTLKIDVLRKLSGTFSLKAALDGSARRPSLKASFGLDKGRLDTQNLGHLAVALEAAVSDLATNLSVRLQAGASRLADTPLLTLEAHTGRLDPLNIARRGLGKLPLKATLTLPGFELAELRGYLPKLPHLAGHLAGTVAIHGDSVAPKAQAKLSLAGLQFSAIPVGDLKIDGDFDGKTRRAGGTIALVQRAHATNTSSATSKTRRTGGTLKAYARVDLKRKEILAAQIKGKRLDIAPFEPLSIELRQLSGLLDLDLHAKGPFAKPQPRGTITLTSGKLRLRGMSLYDKLALKLALTPKHVKLSDLSLHSGHGDLHVKASVDLVDLKPRRFTLDAQANKFTLGAPPLRDGVFSGKVAVKGTFHPGNRLALNVKLDDAAFKLGKISGTRSLHSIAPLPDVVFVDAEAQTTRAKAENAVARGDLPLTLAIAVGADPVMVRGDQLDVEVATGLKVAVDKKGARIRGLVQIRRGRIEILSKKYDVQHARVRFSGERVPNPALDVKLSRRFGDATIFI